MGLSRRSDHQKLHLAVCDLAKFYESVSYFNFISCSNAFYFENVRMA